MKRNDLSQLMRRAWTIARTTGKTFAVCLVKAWQLYRLIKRMRTSVVCFAYEKADGTLRRAIGTLKDTAVLVKGTGHTDNGDTVRYYDMNANGWRSFRVDNLITVY